MDSELRGPVVVGVNGSTHSLTAVEVAAQEAALRHIGLHIVNVIEWPDIDLPIGTSSHAPVIGKQRAQAETILAEALAQAQRTDPTVPVTTEVIVDATRRALVEASRSASVLVVGRRPGLAAFLPDPIGVHLVAHAMSPTIITRQTSGTRTNVVAAVDGTPAAPGVLDFAFREASLRRTGVTLAWSAGTPASHGGTTTPDETDAARVLADIERAHPDVKVQEIAADSTAPASTAQISTDAQMLVVGAPAEGLGHRLHATAAVHGLLRRAMCPVAVIPASLPGPGGFSR